MVSSGTDYIDIVIVGVLWGCTNPFLRKGAVEEDEKVRMQEQIESADKQQQNEAKEESKPLSSKYEASYSYQSTLMSDSSSNHKPLSPDYAAYKLYDDNKEILPTVQILNSSPTKNSPTSFGKGIILQSLDKCCHHTKELLNKLKKVDPKALFKSFLQSIVYELKKFTNPKIAIPFILNQSSAIFYFRLIATSDLTNVAYCSSLSMAIEGVVSYFLGERMSNPVRGFCGALIVTLGVSICLLSKEIDDYITNSRYSDDSIVGYYGESEKYYNGDRHLSIRDFWQGMENSESGLFEISPFVGWYAVCFVVNSFVKAFLV